jgi:hypothetical protein
MSESEDEPQTPPGDDDPRAEPMADGGMPDATEPGPADQPDAAAKDAAAKDAASKPDERGETAGPEPPDEAERKIEDTDPEPEPGDDDAARDDRLRGIRQLMMARLTGERSRNYQAEQMTFFGGEASAVPRHGAVPGTTLRKLITSYVEPPCAGRLREALRVSPVQCVFGPPGQGRTTMAIATAAQNLEDRRLNVDNNVLILASERGLAAVDEAAIPGEKALILTLPPDAAAPDMAWFGAVGEALRGRKSILIVVSATEPVGSAALKADWTVAYVPPSPAEVFRRHLEQRLPHDRVTEVVSAYEVRESVRRCATPRDAADLAAEVINDVENGVPDAELLSGEPTDQLAAARKELQQSGLWDRILLVAATVMADLAAGTVTREAMRLAEMHKPNGVLTEMPRVEWFNGPDRWAGSIKLGDPASDGAGLTVRLAHPRLAIPLLRVIWEDHVSEREVLLPWLCSLGTHRQKRVRVKAAQAAAQFACYDYDVVMREVLQVWALDGRFRSRETCAMALEALAVAAESRFAKRVRGQVQSWARSSNATLLAAAVAAYGTFLGAKDPDEALASMREIAGARVFRLDGRRKAAERAEQGLANIVQRALVDVFTAGAQEKVLQALAAWARAPNWRWRRAAARGLRQLARKDGSGRWPLLVELSAMQDSTYTAVHALWRNALDAENRDEAAWEGLRRWLNQARELRGDDSAGSVVAVVDRLAADLRAGSPDIARHLDFHQQVWAFRETKQTKETDQ